MNKKIKLLIISCILVLLSLFVVSCSSNDDVYEQYNESGYTVSVKFDANGAYFGSAGNLYLLDTYNFDSLKTSEDGNKKELFLIDPNSLFRKKEDRYNMGSSTVKGYFFAGWYKDRTPILDENGQQKKDDLNNPMYSYSGYCDLSLPMAYEIDANPEQPYTADNPVLTLYAAWVRTPTVEIYELIDGKETCVAVYEIKNANLDNVNTIEMPSVTIEDGIHKLVFGTLDDAKAFEAGDANNTGDTSTDTSTDTNTDTSTDTDTSTSTDDADLTDDAAQSGETGKKYKWSERRVVTTEKGDTFTTFFEGFYSNSTRTEKLTGKYTHPYEYDAETATIKNPVIKFYVDYEVREGEWYRVYSAKEFINEEEKDKYPLGQEIELKSCKYELMADIVFDENNEWPRELTTATFKGQIIGNNHKIVNPSYAFTANKNKFAGLFRTIAKDAVIKDVTFENATVTIKNATKDPGARYALLASKIEEGFAFDNVSFVNSKIQIYASLKNSLGNNQEYEFGLLCAEGYHEKIGVNLDGISYGVVTTPDDVWTLTIHVDEAIPNRLLLEFVSKEQN